MPGMETETLDLGTEVVLGEDVERVLHCVGGQDVSVVTGDVRVPVVARQQDTHRHVGDLVAVLAPMELEDAHPRLAVTVRTEHQLPR